MAFNLICCTPIYTVARGFSFEKMWHNVAQCGKIWFSGGYSQIEKIQQSTAQVTDLTIK